MYLFTGYLILFFFSATGYANTLGLIGAWTMSEGSGSIVSDLSTNGYDGILSRNGSTAYPAWVTDSEQGNVLRFTCLESNSATTGNYVNLGSIDVSGDQLTLGVMFKLSRLTPEDGRLIAKQETWLEDGHYWNLGRYPDGKLRFRLRTDGSVTSLVSSQSNLYTTGEWVFAAAVYDGSSMKLYCNGVEVGSVSKTGSIDTNSAYNAYIGVSQNGTDLYPGIEGDISYAFIYDRALSAEEINQFNISGKQLFSEPADTENPTLTITAPAANPYTSSLTPITVSGTASDNVGVVLVSWSNSAGGSGDASGTTSWSASVPLSDSENNVITITAYDAAGLSAAQTITVVYSTASYPFVDVGGTDDGRLILDTTGNVGIGTGTSPLDAKLTVNGGSGPVLRLNATSSGNSGTDGLFEAVVDAETVFNITYDGNVGIGCVNPQTRLAVNGTITATEIKVDALGGWCDYVFAEDYKLPPLEEVAAFIKTNKHLPEIPSEKEVEQNGLMLSGMMALHMKKIEELTLYTIALNKQNQELTRENEALKAEMIRKDKALEKRLQALEALLNQ